MISSLAALNAFAAWIAAELDLDQDEPVIQRAVFAHQAVESDAADVYTVVTCSGGPVVFQGPRTVGTQILTRGPAAEDAWMRAEAIHNLLLDDSCRAIREQAIGDEELGQFVIKAIQRLMPPQLVGLDERGRVMVSQNLDLVVIAAAAA